MATSSVLEAEGSRSRSPSCTETPLLGRSRIALRFRPLQAIGQPDVVPGRSPNNHPCIEDSRIAAGGPAWSRTDVFGDGEGYAGFKVNVKMAIRPVMSR